MDDHDSGHHSDEAEVRRLAGSFGAVAEVYDRGRPAFPREAAAWLAGDQPASVLELGAGTGKLTRELVALGHDVHASDPDAAMLAVLSRELPEVRVSTSGAEEIPLPDRSVDVVVAAQAFHWFDHDRALPEIARVLRPGGRLALAWNLRDERIPWVRRLGRLIDGRQVENAASTQVLVTSELFGFVEEATFSHWQQVDRRSIRDLVASRSYVSTLPDEQREELLAAVVALYDEYGRGMDGMQLPYDCRCYRATVVDRTDHADRTDRTAAAEDRPEPAAGGDAAGDGADQGTDDDMLLIDFR